MLCNLQFATKTKQNSKFNAIELTRITLKSYNRFIVIEPQICCKTNRNTKQYSEAKLNADIWAAPSKLNAKNPFMNRANVVQFARVSSSVNIHYTQQCFLIREHWAKSLGALGYGKSFLENKQTKKRQIIMIKCYSMILTQSKLFASLLQTLMSSIKLNRKQQLNIEREKEHLLDTMNYVFFAGFFYKSKGLFIGSWPMFISLWPISCNLKSLFFFLLWKHVKWTSDHDDGPLKKTTTTIRPNQLLEEIKLIAQNYRSISYPFATTIVEKQRRRLNRIDLEL